MATKVGSIILPIELDTKSLKGAGRKLRNFGKDLKALVAPAVAVGTALAGIGAASLKAAADLEKSLREVNTLLGKTAEGFAQIQQDVIKLSNQLGQSANDLSSALYQAVSAGNDYGAALKVVEQSSKLAVAGVADLTDTVNLITTVLNAWKLEASELEEVSDSLFTAVRLGKTTVSELAASIGQIAPTAKNAGVSLDEINAGLALLTANGLSTAEAVTGLRAILSAVIKPSEEAAQKAKELGIDFSVAAIESKGLATFLGEIGDATGGSVAALAEFFPNARAIGPALTLAANGGEDYLAVLDEFSEKNGATAKGFNELENSTTRQTEKLINQFNNLKITLGQELQPAFNRFLTGVTRLGKALLLARNVEGVTRKLEILAKTLAGVFYSVEALNQEFAKLYAEGATRGLTILKAEAGLTSQEIFKISQEFEKLNGKKLEINANEAAFKKTQDLFKRIAEARREIGNFDELAESDGVLATLAAYEETKKAEIDSTKAAQEAAKKRNASILETKGVIDGLVAELEGLKEVDIWGERIAAADELLAKAKELGDEELIRRAEQAKSLALALKETEELKKQKKEQDALAKEAARLIKIEEQAAEKRRKEAEKRQKEIEARAQSVKDFLKEFQTQQENPATQQLLKDYEKISELLGDALPEDVEKLESAFEKMAESAGEAFKKSIDNIQKRIDEIKGAITEQLQFLRLDDKDYDSRRRKIVQDKSLSSKQKREALEKVNVEFQAERDRFRKAQKIGLAPADEKTARRADELIKGGFSADQAIRAIGEEIKIEELTKKQEQIAAEQKVFEERKISLLEQIANQTAGKTATGEPLGTGEPTGLADEIIRADAEARAPIFEPDPTAQPFTPEELSQITGLGEPVDPSILGDGEEAINNFGDVSGSLLDQLGQFGANVVDEFSSVNERMADAEAQLSQFNDFFAPGGNVGVGAI